MSGDDFTLDELASASLDNEVTADERAIAESDPAVARRIEEFSALRSLVADDGADFDVDGLIGRALAEYDVVIAATSPDSNVEAAASSPPDADSSGHAGAVPPISQLADAREQRRRRSGRLWMPLAVAAMGIGGVVMIANLGGGGESKSSSADGAPLEAAKTVDQAAATTAASASEELDSVEAAALPAATEAAASVAAAAQPATATEAAPVTDAPAATDAPASADAGAPGSPADSLPAIPGPGSATLEPPGGGESGVPIVFNTTEQIALYVRGLISQNAQSSVVPVASACSPGGIAILDVYWSGQAGVLHVIPSLDAPSEAVITDATCAVLVRVPLGP